MLWGGRIKKRTGANLSDWPTDLVEGLRTLLKGGVAVERAEQALTIARSLPHGHVAAVLGTAERLRLPKLLLGRRSRPADARSRDLVLAMIAQRILQPGSMGSHTDVAAVGHGYSAARAGGVAASSDWQSACSVSTALSRPETAQSSCCSCGSAPRSDPRKTRPVQWGVADRHPDPSRPTNRSIRPC
ncbi:hypothetical protein CKO28_22840 [Rhodovibrio sodomensis]|uniref:Uncharacterized protein n=1 Tax=Rhodovibrio sodomensis TaxID=1088 RepID=A0ABS1DK63_9PROT|nr:hypothetical protein [Rhodovibrio sodomensis]